MYHIISTIVTSIILYLISFFFYRLGYYSIQLHRKIWNTILAAAFLLTIVAGLFLALQTNYKWNIPFVKTILKWHVEFGIGLAMTGTFHFLWHLDYFGKLFKEKITTRAEDEIQNVTSSGIKINLVRYRIRQLGNSVSDAEGNNEHHRRL